VPRPDPFNDLRSCLRPPSLLTAFTPLALAVSLLGATLAHAQSAPQLLDPEAVPLKLRLSRKLSSPNGAERPAVVLEAQQLKSQVDQQTELQGDVRLRYGDLLLRSDKLVYDQTRDLARAEGEVELSRGGTVVRGPSLQLYLQRFEGEFLSPQYYFALTGGGGTARSLRFQDASRLEAEQATYSSCPVTESNPTPAWQLTTSQLKMDFEANEGRAQDAVLRFYGVPILAAPSLSFPLGAGRKSGWLPPNIALDNRSGLELGLPYYWNIAPQRDATFTPFMMTRRGAGLDSEFRYLETGHQGQMNFAWLPNDRLLERSRWALRLNQDGLLDGGDTVLSQWDGAGAWRYRLRMERVSDDDYWKDLPRRIESVPQRQLPADFLLNRRNEYGWGELQSYARVQRFQALEGLDKSSQFDTPYQRAPQIGVRVNSRADDLVLGSFLPFGRKARLEGGAELEYNRFEPLSNVQGANNIGGERVHALAHLSLPLGGAGWWLVPRYALNMAAYKLDAPSGEGQTRLSRTVPSFSLDHGWIFERNTSLLGRELLQSLEPRVLYVQTPYRKQDQFPSFDSAPKDFNVDSIYSDNQFSGVDRVSDLHAVTLGVTSRWLDAVQGEELLRLGMAQRMLLSDQRISPDVTANTPVVTSRTSDLLLLGSAHLNKQWWVDSVLQLNPETRRTSRAVMSARYAPTTYRTVSLAYRLARDQSEQVELAWQWPLFGAADRPQRRANSSGASCSGAWYSAGRIQYSLQDRKLSDSVVGAEYDAGCWILRMGVQRLSAGRLESNTQLLLQIELVGLSQLGFNTLQVLKDNIPGYRSLSSDRSNRSNAPND